MYAYVSTWECAHVCNMYVYVQYICTCSMCPTYAACMWSMMCMHVVRLMQVDTLWTERSHLHIMLKMVYAAVCVCVRK